MNHIWPFKGKIGKNWKKFKNSLKNTLKMLPQNKYNICIDKNAQFNAAITET